MMATDSMSAEAADPAGPRLVINGAPVRPEDLCRALPASVQQRLSVAPARRRRARPSPRGGRTSWALGTACLTGWLAVTLWLLWR